MLAYPAQARAQDGDSSTQEVPPPRQTQPSQAQFRQIYTPDYFTNFAPHSALDMLEQVPGFQIESEDDERGLGQATGNVLINGQRLSSKSDSAEDQLARLPAGNVISIEILDGATLDVPGLSGQVANITAKAGSFSGQFTWEPQFPTKYAPYRWQRGSISGSGSAGPLDYTIALSNSGDVGGNGGPATILNGDGTLREDRFVIFRGVFKRPKISSSFTLDGPGSSIANLNVSHEWNDSRPTLTEESFVPDLPDFTRSVRTQDKDRKFEVGGDVDFVFGPGRLKLIGLARNEHSDFFTQSVTDFVDDSASFGRRIEVISDSSERIARTEYSWPMLGGDWQLSGEAAFNTLENASDRLELQPDGSFLGAAFPAGTGGVTEDRYEAILSYSRPLTKKLAMQLTLGGENSKISQTGSNAEVRSFRRPKGSLALTWAPEPGLDISFKISRKVGQLDFNDFLAEVFLDNGNANAGNNQLVPQQSWEADLEVNKDLGEWGFATLKLFNHRIEDLVAIIPLGPDAESKGNIDKARAMGIQLTSTIRFDPIGFKGAKLDFDLLVQDTNIRDPLTFIERPIDDTEGRELEIKFRHDIPGSNWAWGLRYRNLDFGMFHRLREFGEDWGIDDLGEIYIEHKDVFGLTVQARINNLLDSDVLRRRTVYLGPRNSSAVDFTENNIRKVGQIFRFIIKGNF